MDTARQRNLGDAEKEEINLADCIGVAVEKKKT